MNSSNNLYKSKLTALCALSNCTGQGGVVQCTHNELRHGGEVEEDDEMNAAGIQNRIKTKAHKPLPQAYALFYCRKL